MSSCIGSGPARFVWTPPKCNSLLYVLGLFTLNNVFYSLAHGRHWDAPLGLCNKKNRIMKTLHWTDYKFVCQQLCSAGSSPAGSVGRDLNLQKLNYQYLTTSVAVVLVVRWYFNGWMVLFCVYCCMCRKTSVQSTL